MKTPVRLLAAILLAAFPASAAPVRTKIVLVGDSTVTDSAGWGRGFARLLAAEAECLNAARGGRSSKSFRDEGAWTEALALKGDCYLIQFGHNNEPGKPGRSTDMRTFIRDMESYVDETRAAGATPVLVTPLTRRQWDRARPARIRSSLEPYAREVRRIAASKKVPLIDLHALSVGLCESLGKEKCLEFSPPKGEDGARDGTHLNEKGHALFGRLVAIELRKQVPSLAPLLPEALADAGIDAMVASDGSGDHTTVQQAVDGAPGDATPDDPWVIRIKAGAYKELVHVRREKRHLRLLGDNVDSTTITFGLHARMPGPDGREIGTFRTPTVHIEADDFSAERITFENSAGPVGQALAMRVDGDRASFRHCAFRGHQDTLLLNRGRQHFRECTITGAVDFIFGAATAYFDRCTLVCAGDGYITAASTPPDAPFGFVFSKCVVRMTSPDTKTYLGRPWRPHASTIFIGTELPGGIHPEGWDNWRNPDNERTARFSETGSTGPGANAGARIPWATPLDASRAAELTASRVLGGWTP